MKMSAASARTNQLRVSGSDIPAALRTFSFKGAQYRTLHAASGFMDPPLVVCNLTDNTKLRRLNLSVASESRSGGDYFYPAEIISPGEEPITTVSQEVSISTDPYCGMLGKGSYPVHVRMLIEDAWKGNLLPTTSREEGLFFKDRGVSVVFRVSLLELVSLETGLNHVALLIGERQDPASPNRFAAQLSYSAVSFWGLLAMSEAGALAGLALDIAVKHLQP